MVADDSATAPMRRLADQSDSLAPSNAAGAGRYLSTAAHLKTPVPEARAEPAAPEPNAPPAEEEAGRAPNEGGALAERVPEPSSRSASEA
eukprot:5899448-Alexandrium_andersonii.AAC.1